MSPRPLKSTPRRLALLLLSAGAVTPVSAQLTTPAEWRWVTDRPARLVDEIRNPDSEWFFVGMAPGWHLTTGPGALLFEPSYSARGRFTITSEMILFPGASDDGFGLFVGGTALHLASPSYLAFLIRRDGAYSVRSVSAGHARVLVDWRPHDAVRPHPGGEETTANVLGIEVTEDGIVFVANGTEVHRLPRPEGLVEGNFGFRVGEGLNLHITTLDATARLAPIPLRRGG